MDDGIYESERTARTVSMRFGGVSFLFPHPSLPSLELFFLLFPLFLFTWAVALRWYAFFSLLTLRMKIFLFFHSLFSRSIGRRWSPSPAKPSLAPPSLPISMAIFPCPDLRHIDVIFTEHLTFFSLLLDCYSFCHSPPSLLSSPFLEFLLPLTFWFLFLRKDNLVWISSNNI